MYELRKLSFWMGSIALIMTMLWLLNHISFYEQPKACTIYITKNCTQEQYNEFVKKDMVLYYDFDGCYIEKVCENNKSKFQIGWIKEINTACGEYERC